MTSGHYYSLVRNNSGQWASVSDTHVTHVTPTNVFCSHTFKHAYMLVYSRWVVCVCVRVVLVVFVYVCVYVQYICVMCVCMCGECACMFT
jgi:hypothetical protein